MRNRWSSRAVAAVLGMLLVLSGCAPSSSGNDDDNGVANLELEKALVDLIDPDDRSVGSFLDGEGRGFLALELDRGKVVLWWKGAPPSSVSDVLAQHPDASSEVRSAVHSLGELNAAARAATEAVEGAAGVAEGVSVFKVDTARDGSLITLKVTPPDLTDAQVDRLRSLAQVAMDVPVNIEPLPADEVTAPAAG